MDIYVNEKAARNGNGTKESPFQTITQAAQIARPGDTVLVAPGVYREYVDPQRGGISDDLRIRYISPEKGGAVITGAEPVKGWEPYEKDVWTVRIPNGLFGDYNPYTTLVEGDWFISFTPTHTGEVYLNGKAMYEACSLEDVLAPQVFLPSWDPDFTLYKWYTRQEDDCTVLYANFQGADPNRENVEINVRRNCFYPSQTGRGFITLSGFVIKQAATQWAPPTAYQEGMVGPHWSKGWIIEDCEISDSKCSGISLGKYRQEGNDNKWLHKKYKDGTQTERECICQAQAEGWSKETIGSHIVRRCNIHDCGQTGIVGHLGGVFSLIEDNHIHHINNRQNLAGAEIGGIKMHAAIDVIFRRNHIHHCTRGIWLDWQAQGTRVTQNLFHHNTLPNLKPQEENPDPQVLQGIGEDLFVEVSHGPTLIDNNIMLSQRALKLACQGVALVHNLIAGSFTTVGRGTDNGSKTLISPRYTPYHMPHRTEVAGFMTFLHGDARFYNNIFIQQPVHPILKTMEEQFNESEWDDNNITVGTFPYNGYPTFEEWDKEFEGFCGMGSEPSDRYYMHLPVWSAGNLYCNGAKPWEKEKDPLQIAGQIPLELEESEGTYRLKTNLFEKLPQMKLPTVSTQLLGMAFEPEQKFESPDGSPILFDRDYFGNRRGLFPMAGPFVSEQDAQKPVWEI